MSNEDAPELDRITLPKHAVIHYHGIPFKLSDDTIVLGRRENMRIIRDTERRTGSIGPEPSLFERVFGNDWKRF